MKELQILRDELQDIISGKEIWQLVNARKKQYQNAADIVQQIIGLELALVIVKEQIETNKETTQDVFEFWEPTGYKNET